MSQKISAQKKAECISYALAHPEISLEQLALDFGVAYSTLSKWVRAARLAGQEGACVVRQQPKSMRYTWMNEQMGCFTWPP